MSMGGGGGGILGFFANLGTRIIGSAVGFIVGGLALVVALIACSYFIPMAIQGQQAGVKTGAAINGNVQVALGATLESLKTDKQERDYGRQLQRAASKAHMASEKKATP